MQRIFEYRDYTLETLRTVMSELRTCCSWMWQGITGSRKVAPKKLLPSRSSSGGVGGNSGSGSGEHKSQRKIFSRRWSAARNVREDEEKNECNLDELNQRADFSDLFLFGSETFFFRVVELTVMMNCVWLSLWATNFISIASIQSSSFSYQISMAIPIILNIPILGAIVKLAARLTAITSLDFDVIGKLLEYEGELHVLQKELHARISEKLSRFEGDRAQLLRSMFSELEKDAHGEITRAGFKSLIRRLRLHYSEAKFRLLFNSIDITRDGKVSVKEILAVIFRSEVEEEQRMQDEAAIINIAKLRMDTVNEATGSNLDLPPAVKTRRRSVMVDEEDFTVTGGTTAATVRAPPSVRNSSIQLTALPFYHDTSGDVSSQNSSSLISPVPSVSRSNLTTMSFSGDTSTSMAQRKGRKYSSSAVTNEYAKHSTRNEDDLIRDIVAQSHHHHQSSLRGDSGNRNYSFLQASSHNVLPGGVHPVNRDLYEVEENYEKEKEDSTK